jgi:hypothetical protein
VPLAAVTTFMGTPVSALNWAATSFHWASISGLKFSRYTPFEEAPLPPQAEKSAHINITKTARQKLFFIIPPYFEKF